MLTLASRTTLDKRYKIPQGRIVVGRAQFCDVQIPACSQDVSLIFARYPQGWIAHDLQCLDTKLNGKPIPQPAHVVSGDLWEVGSEVFETTVSTELADSHLSSRDQIDCTIIVRNDQAVPVVHKISKSVTVVGHALYCDLCVQEPQFRSQHFLIALSGVACFLHWLDRGGGPTGSGGFARVLDQQCVSIGRTEFKFQIGSKRPAKDRTSSALVETIRDIEALVDSEATATHLDNAVREAAQNVYTRLKQSLRFRPRERAGVVAYLSRRITCWRSLSAVEEAFMENARVHAFTMIGSTLEQDPWDRTLILTFIRMCDVAGLDELCYRTLLLLVELDSKDLVAIRSLARICRHLGRREPSFYRKSIGYWRRMKKIRFPTEEDENENKLEIRAIEQKISDIKAEEAMSKLQHGPPPSLVVAENKSSGQQTTE